MQRSSELSAPIALTIAGHDPSSGAGITADLQVFAAHRIFGTSAITALTVQSTLGVAAVEPVSPGVLRQVLETLEADLPASGVKIGMLGSAAVAAEVAAFLAGKQGTPIVFDPVLVSSSGAALLEPEALEVLRRQLLPAVRWLTPNWAELAALVEASVATLDEAEAAMHKLGEQHPQLTLVATGGDQAIPTDLLRLPDGEIHRFTGEHIETTSTHGTGCAFSSALLCRLLLGDDPVTTVRGAKSFVTEAMHRAPKIGHGRGPLDFFGPAR
jgi:hydroxymethylpyrimidine/phosphomethylpyrimidine kinase